MHSLARFWNKWRELFMPTISRNGDVTHKTMASVEQLPRHVILLDTADVDHYSGPLLGFWINKTIPLPTFLPLVTSAITGINQNLIAVVCVLLPIPFIAADSTFHISRVPFLLLTKHTANSKPTFRDNSVTGLSPWIGNPFKILALAAWVGVSFPWTYTGARPMVIFVRALGIQPTTIHMTPNTTIPTPYFTHLVVFTHTV